MEKSLNFEGPYFKSLRKRYEISKDLSEANKDNNAEKKIAPDVSKEILLCNELLESHAKFKEYELPRTLTEKNCCSMCGKHFSNAFVLKKHFRIHAGDKPHECRICRKTFSQQRHLEMHYRVHSQDKSFACVSWEKPSRKESDLKSHFHIHSQNKLFSSKVCENLIKGNYHVKRHFSTHRRKRPFLSRTCKISFKRKDELEKCTSTHIRGRPFSCETCGTAFKRKDHLDRHFSTHTGIRLFPCSECEQSFKRKHHLQRHFKLHTRSSSYSCNKCMKVFKEKSHLKLHNRTHIHDRSFKCKRCGKIFKRENVLKRHSLIHSQKETSLRSRHINIYKRSTHLKNTLGNNKVAKPFNSISCGMVLRQRGRIRKHLVTHKIDDPYPGEKVDGGFSNKCELPSSSNTQSKNGSFEFDNSKSPHEEERQFSVDLTSNSYNESTCSKEVSTLNKVLIERNIRKEENSQDVSKCVTDYEVNFLLNHQKSPNIIDSQIICSYCGEKFKRRGDLQRHLRVHRLR